MDEARDVKFCTLGDHINNNISCYCYRVPLTTADYACSESSQLLFSLLGKLAGRAIYFTNVFS